MYKYFKLLCASYYILPGNTSLHNPIEYFGNVRKPASNELYLDIQNLRNKVRIQQQTALNISGMVPGAPLRWPGP